MSTCLNTNVRPYQSYALRVRRKTSHCVSSPMWRTRLAFIGNVTKKKLYLRTLSFSQTRMNQLRRSLVRLCIVPVLFRSSSQMQTDAGVGSRRHFTLPRKVNRFKFLDQKFDASGFSPLNRSPLNGSPPSALAYYFRNHRDYVTIK